MNTFFFKSLWLQQQKNLHAHLVTVHHEVVCGYQGFEDHHPAGVADPLDQRVDHLGHVHVGLVLGGLDQVWRRNEPSRSSARERATRRFNRKTDGMAKEKRGAASSGRCCTPLAFPSSQTWKIESHLLGTASGS